MSFFLIITCSFLAVFVLQFVKKHIKKGPHLRPFRHKNKPIKAAMESTAQSFCKYIIIIFHLYLLFTFFDDTLFRCLFCDSSIALTYWQNCSILVSSDTSVLKYIVMFVSIA